LVEPTFLKKSIDLVRSGPERRRIWSARCTFVPYPVIRIRYPWLADGSFCANILTGDRTRAEDQELGVG
jgi:hypothetical protein